MLSPALTRKMMLEYIGTWGGQDSARGWYSSGHNEGYNSEMLILPGKAQGVVVMTNGNYGSRLSNEILRGFAKLYGWNNPQPIYKKLVHLDRLR